MMEQINILVYGLKNFMLVSIMTMSTIRQLMLPPEPKKRRIGFLRDD